MFEWVRVATTSFRNANGQDTEVKLIHEHIHAANSYTVDVQGKDLDLIAFEQLETEAESLRILENNDVVLSEYDFDMEKIKQLAIPLN